MQTLVLSPGRRQCEDSNQWQQVRRGDLILIPVCTTKTTVYSSHLDATVYFPLYFPFVEPPFCKFLLKTVGYDAKERGFSLNQHFVFTHEVIYL